MAELDYKEIAARSGLGSSNQEVEKYIDAFNKFDLDGNGHIDESELTKVMQEIGEPCSQQLITEAIAEVDLDNNGTVEFDEFLQVISNLKKGKKPTVFGSAVNKKTNVFQQKIENQTKKDYEEGKKKKSWSTTGNSGGYSLEGKYKSGIVKTPTKFSKAPPSKKSVSDLP